MLARPVPSLVTCDLLQVLLTSTLREVAASTRTVTVAAAAKANQATTERTARAGHPRSKRQSAPVDGAAPSQSQPRQVSAYYGFPARMPSPHETKMEQARLLSLFRSIHPASIVDQLCKGIGYFGGVPGAPPPPGGVFPLSESFNGNGTVDNLCASNQGGGIDCERDQCTSNASHLRPRPCHRGQDKMKRAFQMKSFALHEGLITEPSAKLG